MATLGIEANRSATRALRSVAAHFICRASQALASADPSDAAVHNARKDLKRSRTALRLLRPSLGKVTYHRENVLLRNAAHALNAARDAKVLTQTLQSLRHHDHAMRNNAAIAALLRALQAEQAGLRLGTRQEELARMQRALKRLCGRVKQWEAGAHGWSVVGPALKRIYGSGRRALPTGRSFPSDRSLHEWRKQVKYLRYALELLLPMRPRKLAQLARQAERLTDYLGQVHDVAMLAAKARRFARRNRVDLQLLFSTIERLHSRLTLAALERGRRLYRARPCDWERPLQAYWHRWQHRSCPSRVHRRRRGG